MLVFIATGPVSQPKSFPMSQPKILAFAGSVRQKSYNHQLLTVASQAAEEAGAIVTVLNLRDYTLPIFDEDFEAEQGAPENARRLQQLFIDHDGLLLASPEYNSSITPLLKNVIDWVSRPIPDQPPLAAYRGKFAALLAASPGALGGLRGLVHVRAILGNIGVTVLPQQFALSKASGAFNSDGRLADEKQQQTVTEIGRTLAQTIAKFRA